MIPSMFNLDHRLAEIRPNAAELRVARQLREAAGSSSRPARSVGDTVRAWLRAARPARGSSRLATH